MNHSSRIKSGGLDEVGLETPIVYRPIIGIRPILTSCNLLNGFVYILRVIRIITNGQIKVKGIDHKVVGLK